MNGIQSVPEMLLHYAPLIFAISILLLYFAQRRLKALKSAQWIVENQHKPVPPEAFDDLIDYAEKLGKKDRVLKILQRARIELGHENLKVGHIAWLSIVGLEESAPVNDINIPSFVKNQDEQIE